MEEPAEVSNMQDAQCKKPCKKLAGLEHSIAVVTCVTRNLQI